MEIEEIKKKIEEVRQLILSTNINPTTYDYYNELLDIENKLWNLMFFVKNQEETWLIK